MIRNIAGLIKNDTAWLVIFVVIVLGLPIVMGRAGMGRAPFDDTIRERIAATRPDVVFVGDSMVETRIDPDRLGELTTVPFHVLEHNGSASGMWYLFLKNSIAQVKPPPKRVVIFFRDRYLTDPIFRLRGQYLDDLQSAMLDDEPVVQQFLRRPDGSRFEQLALGLEWLYPSQQLREPVADELIENAQVTAQKVLRGEVDFEEKLDETFDLKRLRPDVPSELASANLNQNAFDPSPTASFLPHLISVARENGIALTFYRVKRRPQSGDIRTDSPELKQYIQDLRAYLEANGVEMIDESSDEAIGIAFYGDGDHVADEMRRAYTEYFFHRNPGIFQ